MLGDASSRLVSSSEVLPEAFEGVLVANELLDAMPVHQVVQRDHELNEIYIDADGERLRVAEGPLSTPRIVEYLNRLDIRLEPGWRVEINLAAADWIGEVARRLRRGFVILIDYGHAARELYSVTHSTGTLTTFSRHQSAGPEAGVPAWLANPGEQDITAHVDFTGVRTAAESEGLKTIAFLDQTYFLLGLLQSSQQSALRNLQTLITPGGLGSTMKVLVLGRNVGAPELRGCSFSVRVT
jgi:SAM-dependent MidA family methyltransferase